MRVFCARSLINYLIVYLESLTPVIGQCYLLPVVIFIIIFVDHSDRPFVFSLLDY